MDLVFLLCGTGYSLPVFPYEKYFVKNSTKDYYAKIISCRVKITSFLAMTVLSDGLESQNPINYCNHWILDQVQNDKILSCHIIGKTNIRECRIFNISTVKLVQGREQLCYPAIIVRGRFR